MSTVQTVRVVIQPSAVVDALQQQGSPVMQGMARLGTATVGYARVDLIGAGIGDTGKLAQQIESQTAVSQTTVTTRVVSRARNEQGVPYGIFVHEGTRGPIVPRRTRVLRFRGRSGAFVFKPEVQGTRETGRFTPFLTNALERLRTDDMV